MKYVLADNNVLHVVHVVLTAPHVAVTVEHPYERHPHTIL